MEINEAVIKITEILVEINERKKDDFALPINLNASLIQNIIIYKE